MSVTDERAAAQLADADRAARRQRLAALALKEDRTPNGIPPRVMPGEKIPGEPADYFNF